MVNNKIINYREIYLIWKQTNLERKKKNRENFIKDYKLTAEEYQRRNEKRLLKQRNMVRNMSKTICKDSKEELYYTTLNEYDFCDEYIDMLINQCELFQKEKLKKEEELRLILLEKKQKKDNFSKNKLIDLCKELIGHLDYCGWGDSWERSCCEDLQKKSMEFLEIFNEE